MSDTDAAETEEYSDMDEAFGSEDTEVTAGRQSFGEGVLAKRRDQGANRQPQRAEVTWDGEAYDIWVVRPPATKLQSIIEGFEEAEDEGGNVGDEELEEVYDEYVHEPPRKEVKETLTYAEYEIYLMKSIRALAGMSDELKARLREELGARSDGDEGN